MPVSCQCHASVMPVSCQCLASVLPPSLPVSCQCLSETFVAVLIFMVKGCKMAQNGCRLHSHAYLNLHFNPIPTKAPRSVRKKGNLIILFCFGWPVEPPPPGVGQLCRTLGKSRPAASLGRPGGPEWAQFVLIPYALAGTALRPSWKGDTKRVPAILGSVGGPCRERVWPSTRPARRL